jgi:protein tyrosine phosphatase (PTP) superfamily phosphohydrolase (DUF442 family)
MNRNGPRYWLLAAGMVVVTLSLAGCHTLWQCPILQGLSNWTIPSPLPPGGDTYTVVGFRDGIRFYIVKYNDNIYRSGDMLAAQGADALKQLGIKTIITTSSDEKQRSWATQRGMGYVEIPFGWNDMTSSDLQQFIQAVDANPGPICAISRTGTLRAGILVAYYRVKKEGWTVDKALDEYYRLAANFWDSIPMVETMKNTVAAAPATAPAGKP